MTDLIDRQAAIATAISGRIRTLPTTEDGENWIRVSEVRESLLTLPSAQPVDKDIYVPINDTISRQAAVDGFYEMSSDIDYLCNVGDYVKYLESMPSAQPELIRCKDCKYWQDQEDGVVEVPICARPENKFDKHPMIMIIGKDGFCSFAERREK